MNMGSRDLVRRAASGDMDAFAELFEPLRGFVYAVAYRLVGPDNADDVVMDTFLKAWRGMPRFRRGSSLKTWLYRVAHNCALDHIRARSRRGEVPLPDDDPENYRQLPDTKQDSPDHIMERNEDIQRVHQALTRLPDVHRIALQFRYTDGLSYSEIAAATGVSIGTVMSRLFNGQQKLRVILETEMIV